MEIHGVEPRDAGEWECEVGAVVGEDFMTRRDAIMLDVKSRTLLHSFIFIPIRTYVHFQREHRFLEV